MTDFDALIARLENAEGPDRELDAKIARAIGVPLTTTIGDGVITEEHSVPSVLRHYTGSLDAAVTLVPEGWCWSLFHLPRDLYMTRGNYQASVADGHFVYVGAHGKAHATHREAPTAELALCTAVFKARKAAKDGNQSQ